LPPLGFAGAAGFAADFAVLVEAVNVLADVLFILLYM